MLHTSPEVMQIPYLLLTLAITVHGLARLRRP